jgi:hypothetical protein
VFLLGARQEDRDLMDEVRQISHAIGMAQGTFDLRER